jgi:hypothetical protein
MPAFIILCLLLPKFAGIVIIDSIQRNISTTELVGVKVTLGSNLGHDIDYPDWFFVILFGPSRQMPGYYLD